MHLKRWISSLIALPFLILLIHYGGIYFVLLVSMAIMLSLWEFNRIIQQHDNSIFESILQLFPTFFFSILIIGAVYIRSFNTILVIIALYVILSGFISLFQFKNNPGIIHQIAQQVLGLIYITVFLSLLIPVRNSTDGNIWIFFLLFIIFSGDTSAFYFGTYMGKHKLCPSVSPGKTIEGALGGLAANLIVGLLFKSLFLKSLPWGWSILFIISIGVVGQIGDLFESEFKRSAKVKDSGGILPGHGGILDRIDALLFAAPVVYLFKEYIFP